MKLSMDLHIHSALSPCASDDMTPNNIVNMAHIKGLDIIAITDHNSMENVETVIKLGEKRKILVLPGIEVTSKEEVHLLCYFEDVRKGLEFGEIIYKSLPNIPSNEKIFGHQLIFDINDQVIGKADKLLLGSSSYSIEEISLLTKEFYGVMVPAHIDRQAFSLLSVLGFIPENLDINTVEISSYCEKCFIEQYPYLKKYNIITNSDAHDLYVISEPIYFADVDILSTRSIFEYLRGKRGR